MPSALKFEAFSSPQLAGACLRLRPQPVLFGDSSRFMKSFLIDLPHDAQHCHKAPTGARKDLSPLFTGVAAGARTVVFIEVAGRAKTRPAALNCCILTATHSYESIFRASEGWLKRALSFIFRRVSDVTQMLQAVQRGDAQAAADLLPLVYEELRRIAASKMAQEPLGHTLQPTALVHEAWLRMVGDGNPEFAGRAHFFAVAAEAMRRILIDAARRRRSLKRGGAAQRTELHDSLLIQNAPSEEMLAVNEALDLLAAEKPAAADLVKLRYFVGMTMEEAAAALGLSLRTAGRLWTYARAWLRQRIEAGRG